MNRAIDILVGWIIDLLAPLGAVVVILVFAVLVAALGLLVFRLTSNQEGIRRGKAKMKAGMLGVLIFRHDLRQMFTEMGRSLLASLANLRFLVVPMLVMFLPLWFLFEYLDLRLGFRPLRVGESAVVRVHGVSDGVLLKAPAGLSVTSPGVRIPALSEVDFRIRVEAPGDHLLEVQTDTDVVTKRVCATRPLSLLPPQVDDSPGGSRIDSIELAYEPVSHEFLGIDWAWWVLLIVFMIPALFLLRRPFGVDF